MTRKTREDSDAKSTTKGGKSVKTIDAKINTSKNSAAPAFRVSIPKANKDRALVGPSVSSNSDGEGGF